MRHKLRTMTVAAILGAILAVQSASAGNKEILMSAAVPGLGQLQSGSTVKGLALMGAEILALHLFFDNLSRYNGLVKETENLQAEMAIERNSSYEQKSIAVENWEESYDEALTRDKMIIPLLGAVAAVWAFSVVDMLIFPPAESNTEPLMEENTEDQSDAAHLEYNLVLKDKTPHLMLTLQF